MDSVTSMNEDGQAQERPKAHLVRRLGVAALVVAVLVALDVALTYALVPYGGMIEAIWYRYNLLADEEIDTLFVGSSYAMSFVPEAMDAELGSSSFNMSTPSESPEASLLAIEDAYEEHHIKRAILGVAVGSMDGGAHEVAYDIAFSLAEAKGRPLSHALRTYLRLTLGPDYLGTADSIASLLPWSSYHVDWSPSEIAYNIERKQSLNPEEALLQDGYRMTERGYVYQGGSYDPNAKSSEIYAATASEYYMTDEARKQFQDIGTYCQEHDIALYVVVTPRPDFIPLAFEEPGGYALVMAEFEEAIESAGGTFVDFSFVRPELYEVIEGDFRDVGHLNVAGSERFSTALGNVIARIEAGEDVSSLFYAHTQEGWKDYLSTVKSVSRVTYVPEVKSDGIALAMHGFAGPYATVEYQVSIKNGDSYEVLRPYEADETFEYPTTGHGKVTLRVDARLAGIGEGDQPVRYCEQTILY